MRVFAKRKSGNANPETSSTSGLPIPSGRKSCVQSSAKETCTCWKWLQCVNIEVMWRSGRKTGASAQRALWRGPRRGRNVMRCNAPRSRKRQARTTWSNAGRPGSKARFMENRDNGLPLLHAPGVYLDIAAGRNSASRIVPCRNLGPRRARRARFFHGARQYRSVARGMPPRRRRQRRKTWGRCGAAGQQSAAHGEERN